MDDFWYKRYYEGDQIFKKGKVTVLEGPRRVGKTELIKKLISGLNSNIFSGSGDNLELQEILSSRRLTKIMHYLDGYNVVFIDEAQKIPEVGTALKILIDNSPEKIVIATGSASFDLANKVGEPLTDRKINDLRQLPGGTKRK